MACLLERLARVKTKCLVRLSYIELKKLRNEFKNNQNYIDAIEGKDKPRML